MWFIETFYETVQASDGYGCAWPKCSKVTGLFEHLYVERPDNAYGWEARDTGEGNAAPQHRLSRIPLIFDAFDRYFAVNVKTLKA